MARGDPGPHAGADPGSRPRDDRGVEVDGHSGLVAPRDCLHRGVVHEGREAHVRPGGQHPRPIAPLQFQLGRQHAKGDRHPRGGEGRRGRVQGACEGRGGQEWPAGEETVDPESAHPGWDATATSLLERDDFSSNRHPALPYCWSMVFSENRSHFSGSCSKIPQVSEFHPKRPWQCLNFLPEPHGQASLRPTLPQVVGSLGSRATAELTAAPALRARVATASDIASSSSPVAGLRWCASMNGRFCCGSGGGCCMISTRMSCAVTASRRCESNASNSWNASDLYSFKGSRCPKPRRPITWRKCSSIKRCSRHRWSSDCSRIDFST